jgi:N-acyl-D-amino-acid deacylase
MPRHCRLLAVIALFSTGTQAADYDVVLRQGRIADGMGKPAYVGDVALRGGIIAAIGTVPGTGRVELDVAGKVVAPGFIDVHTHAEDVAERRLAENFLRMGVTTIVTGNCGSSKPDVPALFAALEQQPASINVATLIGHNTVRAQAMGGRHARPPTGAELDRMRELIASAMQAGAVGLSTGLIYLPGTFARTDELVALAAVAAAHGGIYVSHMRYENTRIFEALDELTRIAREARLPAHVSHLKLSGPSAWSRAADVLAYLDRARAAGLTLTHDQYVYTASSTGISTLIPASAREGARNTFLEILRDPQRKAELVTAMKTSLRNAGRTDYAYAVIASFSRDPRLNGKTIPEAAALVRGADTLDDQIEMILEIESRGGAQGVYHGMHEPDLRTFLAHPLTMFASDAGIRRFGEGVPHPRGYGNNARVLGRYVRDLRLLTLEEAVRRMTSLPARTFQLGARGTLEPGAAADVVVFDPDTVSDPAAYDNPHQYAVGFSDVFVNGVAVIRAGALTGANPGRPVRRVSSPAVTPPAGG